MYFVCTRDLYQCRTRRVPWANNRRGDGPIGRMAGVWEHVRRSRGRHKSSIGQDMQGLEDVVAWAIGVRKGRGLDRGSEVGPARAQQGSGALADAIAIAVGQLARR